MNQNNIQDIIKNLDINNLDQAAVLKYALFFYFILTTYNKNIDTLDDIEMLKILMVTLYLHYYTEKFNIFTSNDIINILNQIKNKQIGQITYETSNDNIKIDI